VLLAKAKALMLILATLYAAFSVLGQMENNMLGLAPELKILNSVVFFVSVCVMYYFAWKKFSAKMLFHDKPMNINLLSFMPFFNIPSLSFIRAALLKYNKRTSIPPDSFPMHRTETVTIMKPLTSFYRTIPALFTSWHDLNIHEVLWGCQDE
jgi:hypothetical protein